MKHLRDTLNVILPFIGVGILIFVIFGIKSEEYPEEGIIWENKNCPFHKDCAEYKYPKAKILFPEKEEDWEAHKPMREKVKVRLFDPNSEYETVLKGEDDESKSR